MKNSNKFQNFPLKVAQNLCDFFYFKNLRKASKSRPISKIVPNLITLSSSRNLSAAAEMFETFLDRLKQSKQKKR